MFEMTHTGKKKVLKAVLRYSPKKLLHRLLLLKLCYTVCFNLLCIVICFVAEDIIYYVITT